MARIIALGDLHGHVETLARLRQVQAQYPGAITVFNGDYIDSFGPNQGFKLLEEIHALQLADPQHTVVLMGNHEQAAVNFFDKEQSDWLTFGGDHTLKAVAKSLGGNGNVSQDRQLILTHKPELLAWLRTLPLTYVVGRICLVHAGLDLTLDDPIRDTSDDDRLWLRASYWYANSPNFGIFGRNPLPVSIVTGHTASGWISGKYARSEGQVPDDKIKSTDNSIYAIQYPGEFPRYLIDGGAGGNDLQDLGNISVFDSETGLLIDKFED